ncbi:hypothetical protein HPB47_023695 [Ixodes persulcatus]|uniref:Uncharacterized protein n=1 Tax=Ixodes persulcatus TaxID=34615 RepID=A0AC60Q7F4_IXOPE|nr:hypothetical protein HPB47_023695 [Ixodes persulcatus]
MDTAAALTSGTRGQQAEVKAQQQLEPARTTAIDLDAGLLGKLGITKEDIGKLVTTLLHSYIQGTLTPGWMESQQRNAMESQEPKTNTIALTTRNEEIIKNLLKVTEIPKGEDSYALSPYKAMGNDQVRGVIYLHGDNSDETPETLLPDLECRTAKVVYARLMGKKGNAVVITFEGTWLPKKVMFCREVFTVKPYRPRPIVCFSCHNIGHKTDVCPSKESRCDQCGHIHEEEMEECTRDPQCKNCGGAHVATSNNCPKRKIPEKKQPAKPPQPKLPRESYAAAAKATATSQAQLRGQQNTQQEVIQIPPNPGKPTVDSNEKMAAPNWIPEWAQRTKAKSTEQPDWRKEVQALEARFEKQEFKIAKFEKDVEMGFNMPQRTVKPTDTALESLPRRFCQLDGGPARRAAH